MANSTKGNLLPNTVNTPLDARARVATLADVANIQNPELGGIFYCVETGKHYKITALASKTIGAIPVENAAVGSYEELVAETGQGTAEITEVSDNIATLAGTNVPVGVRTNSGTYYPIEKGSVVIDITNGQIKLDVTPYLAYDNAASFTGPWTVYYAAGSKGDKGDNALSFQIGTVTTLAAGASATAEAAISDEGLVTLNLGIPQGANGADGQDGSDGEDADATAAIDTHNSDASAHTAIQNKFASYLPLAGGTMTGVINRNGILAGNPANGGNISLRGGTSSFNNGGALVLYDKDNPDRKGYFLLQAGDGTNIVNFCGKPDGTLVWGNYNVLRDYFTRANNTGTIQLFSGTGYTTCGFLQLYGALHSENPGEFKLGAADGTNVHTLVGKPDGQLLWDGVSLLGQAQKSLNGYTKLPNGIIIQWGSTASTASSVSATFPIAFTAAPIVIPHSPSDGVGIAVSATTTSATFTISSGSINVKYIAIGY